eukprot:scaffold260_cov274-Pinguiococcus_pyrenoidosus.AAC.29
MPQSASVSAFISSFGAEAPALEDTGMVQQRTAHLRAKMASEAPLDGGDLGLGCGSIWDASPAQWLS